MKIIVKTFLFLIIFFALILGSLPYVLSTKKGTELLSDLLSRQLKGKVNLEELNLDWRKKPQLKTLHFERVEKNFSVHAEELILSSSLFSIALRPYQLPRLIISQLNIHDTPEPKPSSSLFINQALIKNCNLLVQQGSERAFEIKNTFLDYSFSKDLFNFKAKGHSVIKGQQGIFDLSFDGSFKDTSFNGKMKTTGFPIQTVDYLLKKENYLSQILGASINSDGSFNFSNDHLFCSFECITPTVKGSFHTKQEKNLISLMKPSFVSLSLDQKSFHKLCEKIAGLQNLVLQNSGSLQLFLDDFKANYENHKLNFSSLSYQARLFSSPLNFIIKNTKKNLILNSSTLSCFSRALTDELNFNLKSSFNYNQKNPCYLATSCTLESPLKSPKLGQLSANVSKCPTLVFEELFKTSFPLNSLIGENLDLSIESKPSNDEKIISLKASSPTLELSKFSLNYKDEKVQLIESATISFKPLPNFLEGYLKLPLCKIEELGLFKLKFKELEFSHKEFLSSGIKDLNYKVELTCDKIDFTSPLTLGFSSLEDFSWHFEGINQDKLNHFGLCSLIPNDPNPLQKNALGSNIRIEWLSILERHPLQGWSIPLIQASAKNDQIAMSIEGLISPHLEKLELIKPISLQWVPSGQLFNLLLDVPETVTSYQLKTPIQINSEIDPLRLDQNFFDHLIFNISAQLDQLKIINKTTNESFLINNTLLAVLGSSVDGNLNAKINGEIKNSSPLSKTSSFSLSYLNPHFKHKDFLRSPYHLDVELSLCPTPFLDTALGYNQALTVLLGERTSLASQIERQDSTYQISSDINSPHLRAHIEVEKTPDFITLKNKKFEGDFLLKKDSYSALEELLTPNAYSSQRFSLTREAHVQFAIEELKWALHQKEHKNQKPFIESFFSLLSSHLDKTALNGTLKIPELSIYNKETHQTVLLENFSLDCTKNEGLNPFLFDLYSKISDDHFHTGNLVASISLQNRSMKENTVLESKIQAKLSKFPSMLFDMGFQLAGFTHALPSLFLGDFIDATFSCKLQDLTGTLDFDAHSSQCEGSLHALINNDYLKLIEPIRAKISISAALADYFFKNMNVILLSSSRPLELYIDNKGFYFPIKPFNLDKFQVRSGLLSIGQILCKNKGNPEDIGGFFKLNLSSSAPISLWFAPMEFSLNNGIFYIDRTEVLYNDSYQIAFWGKMDLDKKKVKMTLGLTEQSLQKALGIQGLPRSFVLQIPMEGPIDNVRINKELATARIALLVAKTSGLTNYGGVWGGIASALHEFANDQTVVPPAKPPFPWQNTKTTSSEKVNIIK